MNNNISKVLVLFVIYVVLITFSNEFLHGNANYIVNSIAIISYALALWFIIRKRKSRDKVILTEELLEFYKKNGFKDSCRIGICTAMLLMKDKNIYSEEEYFVVSKLLKSNKPNTDQYFCIYMNNSFTGGNYWWKRNKDGFNQAVMFLEELNNKYKS